MRRIEYGLSAGQRRHPAFPLCGKGQSVSGVDRIAVIQAGGSLRPAAGVHR